MSDQKVNYPTDADCHSILTDNDSLRARIDALTAERDRYRTALEHSPCGCHVRRGHETAYRCLRCEALRPAPSPAPNSPEFEGIASPATGEVDR